MRRILLAVGVLLLGAAFAATTASAQTPGTTITPSDGYGSACPASGTELADSGWCDLKVEYPDAVIDAQPVDYRGDRDEIDPSPITIEGVTGGTATAIACESHSPSGWFRSCGEGIAYLNWNRIFNHWEVWIDQQKVKESDHATVKVSVGSATWEGVKFSPPPPDTGGLTPQRTVAHNTGQQPVVVTNADEVEAWNTFKCPDGQGDYTVICDSGDEGAKFWPQEPVYDENGDTQRDENGNLIVQDWEPDPPPADPIPGWIQTACAANGGIWFENSMGMSEACP